MRSEIFVAVKICIAVFWVITSNSPVDGYQSFREIYTASIFGVDNSDGCSKFSPNIIRQIKSRRMRWAEHVAHKGVGRNV
jgi:hypothetical protein